MEMVKQAEESKFSKDNKKMGSTNNRRMLLGTEKSYVNINWCLGRGLPRGAN